MKLVAYRKALPADSRPRLQSHLFELSRRFLILLRVRGTSRCCIIRWSKVEHCRQVTCGNLHLWRHLRADQRTGCKLQRLPSLILLRPRVSLHFAESLNIELRLKFRFRTSWFIAADMRPKKFRTKWQRIVYDGPTARKDAESAERDRWIQLLANLLRSTDTPMGKLIRENPSNIQLLGGGRRAGTLRSRVRSVQKFLGWLIASHGVSFPVHWRQLTEYLQVRYSEPCVKGSLKLVHSSYIFLQEVAGIEDKLTDSSMYVVALKVLESLPAKLHGSRLFYLRPLRTWFLQLISRYLFEFFRGGSWFSLGVL